MRRVRLHRQELRRSFTLDNFGGVRYNLFCLFMRLWRNRHTRTFEGRVVNTVRVQVSSTAPRPEIVTVSGFLLSFFDGVGQPNLTERGLLQYGDLASEAEAVTAQCNALPSALQTPEKRMAEIAAAVAGFLKVSFVGFCDFNFSYSRHVIMPNRQDTPSTERKF